MQPHHSPVTDRLLLAAAQGTPNQVQSALLDGAEIDVRTPEGDNALHLACAMGHPDCVEMLVKAGVDPNARNADGRTPAHEAVICARPSTLFELIRTAGDDIDWSARDRMGMTVEELAVVCLQSTRQVHEPEHEMEW